jgi:hypothetical protein
LSVLRYPELTGIVRHSSSRVIPKFRHFLDEERRKLGFDGLRELLSSANSRSRARQMLEVFAGLRPSAASVLPARSIFFRC